MVRTVISLDLEDKLWLDQRAAAEHVPMAEVVRRAVRRYRRENSPEGSSFEALLLETSGIWTEGDGLHFQQVLRDEWDTPR